MKRKRALPESRLQKVVVNYLMMNGAFFFSIPNEGQRSIVMGAHLKAMGMLPGVADLCILIDGRAHFLELKAAEGTRSASQRDFAARCTLENIPYYCANNVTDALKILSEWGAIRPVRVAA